MVCLTQHGGNGKMSAASSVIAYDETEFDESDHDDDDDAQDGDHTKPAGRISNEHMQMIRTSFDQALAIAQGVADKTRLTVNQVLDHWTLTRARRHVRNNLWNLYGQYFKGHLTKELSRLTQGESIAYLRPH